MPGIRARRTPARPPPRNRGENGHPVPVPPELPRDSTEEATGPSATHPMHSAHANSSDGLPEVAADADHMPTGRAARDRAQRRDAERRRRERTEQRAIPDPSAQVDAPQRQPADPGARRRAAVSCAWCGSAMTPPSRGPIPKWCSVNCRRRAWEHGRAAASGRSAVEVVERRVEIMKPLTPTRRDGGPLPAELARQLEDGRIYERDLPALGAALATVLEAHQRRPTNPPLSLVGDLRSCRSEQRFRGPLPEDAGRADAGAAEPRQACGNENS